MSERIEQSLLFLNSFHDQSTKSLSFLLKNIYSQEKVRYVPIDTITGSNNVHKKIKFESMVHSVFVKSQQT